MASRLSIYNDAAIILGERRLKSATESQPFRYRLDDAWDADLVKSILEDQDWNCFIVTVKSDGDESTTVEFGYSWVHPLPDDLARISSVCYDERNESPITDHQVESGKIYTDTDPIYLRYIPTAEVILQQIENWPAYFARYVAACLAMEVAPTSKNSTDQDRINNAYRMRKATALSNDSQVAPSKRFPRGRWAQARGGSRYGYRGNRG